VTARLQGRTCHCGSPLPPGAQRYCSPGCRPARLRYPLEPEAGSEPTGDRDELLQLLWAAARRGSVAAMQTLRRELEPGDGRKRGPSLIDELGERRRKVRESGGSRTKGAIDGGSGPGDTRDRR
jgi:hypothetical protein